LTLEPSPLAPAPEPAKRKASTSLPFATGGSGALMPSLLRLMLAASRPFTAAGASGSSSGGASSLSQLM
jgi:hypothetical protein